MTLRIVDCCYSFNTFLTRAYLTLGVFVLVVKVFAWFDFFEVSDIYTYQYDLPCLFDTYCLIVASWTSLHIVRL